jgi:hypothetical protein
MLRLPHPIRMPITRDALSLTPFYIGNFSGFSVARLRGEHSPFDWNSVRVTLNITPAGPVQLIAPQKSASGDTVYLSYFTDEISSVRLPFPAPPGVTTFLTDNLSGCKVYVDKVQGTNDVIVYHANARAFSPPGKASGTHPSLEPAQAAQTLDQLHTRAQADYAAAPYNLTVQAGNSISKPAYNLKANMEVVEKLTQGATNAEFLGGTLVVGFATGSGWKFHFQTYGDVEFDRSATSIERYTKGKHSDGRNTHVIDTGCFY